MKMTDIAKKLKDARNRIDSIKAKRAELVGQKKTLLARLQKDFGLDTPKAAEAKLIEMEAEQKDREKEMDGLVEELDELMEKMTDGV